MKSWFFWILLLFSLKDNLLHAQDYNSILSLMIYKCVSPAWTFPVSCRPPQPTPHHTSHLLSLSQPHTVCVTLSFRAPSASMCTKPETRCLSHSPHFMSQWAILGVRFFHPLLLPPPGPQTQTSCQRLSHGSWLWEPPSWHPPTHPCLKWALQATDLCYHPFHQNSSFCLKRKKVENILLKREEKVFSGLVLALLSTLLSVPSSHSLHSNHRALKCAEFPWHMAFIHFHPFLFLLQRRVSPTQHSLTHSNCLCFIHSNIISSWNPSLHFMPCPSCLSLGRDIAHTILTPCNSFL